MLTGLHVILSYRCTHQCDHCFVHSGPGARGTFTLDQLRRTLAEAVLIGTVLDELERTDRQVGLVTMCAAGGMAPAIIIERI